MNKWRSRALGAVGLIAFLLLWQWLAMGPLADTSLPYADSTLRRLVELAQTRDFWAAVWKTLYTAAQGFLIATLIAIPLGLLVGTNPYAAAIFKIPIEVAKPIPPIVVLPLVVYELGPTASMARFLTVIGLVPSLVIATSGGVRELDPVRRDTARSFRMGPMQRARRIVLPSAMPSIVTGLRIAAFVSILIVVMSQIVGGAPGLGAEVSRSQRAGQPESTYALVIAIALLGLTVDFGVTYVERRLLRWHESVRGERPVVPRRVRFASITESFSDTLDKITRPISGLIGAIIPDRSSQKAPNRWIIAALTWGTPILLIAWWWQASANSTNAFFVPLKKILQSFKDLWLFDRFGPDAIPSLRNLAIGFVIAAVVGIAIGMAMGMVPFIRELLEPLLALVRSIPGVAFIPILVTLIGFGNTMRISTIALAASFPIMISAADGIRGMDPMMKDVSAAYRLSRTKQVWSVYLPAALPRIMTGLEIGLATAFVVMIASELTGVTVGIGAQTILAQQSFQFADMWAGVVLLAIIGVITSALLELFSRWVLAWHRGARAAARAA